MSDKENTTAEKDVVTNADESVEESVEETNALIEQRRSKLAALRQEGHAFPNDFRRDVMAV